jgi:hypothetical protein
MSNPDGIPFELSPLPLEFISPNEGEDPPSKLDERD